MKALRQARSFINALPSTIGKALHLRTPEEKRASKGEDLPTSEYAASALEDFFNEIEAQAIGAFNEAEALERRHHRWSRRFQVATAVLAFSLAVINILSATIQKYMFFYVIPGEVIPAIVAVFVGLIANLAAIYDHDRKKHEARRLRALLRRVRFKFEPKWKILSEDGDASSPNKLQERQVIIESFRDELFDVIDQYYKNTSDKKD